MVAHQVTHLHFKDMTTPRSKNEEERDRKMVERSEEDPGAGFTDEAKEESINTRWAQPPKEAPPTPRPGSAQPEDFGD